MYFDIDIGGEKAGRIVFELSADVVPKTAGACMLRMGWLVGPVKWV